MGRKKTIEISKDSVKTKSRLPETKEELVSLKEKENLEKPAKEKKKARGKSEKKVLKKSKKGANYLKALKQIEKKKIYSPEEAMSLLKKIAWANFNEAVEAHLVVKREGISVKVNFPHDQGKRKTIAIADNKETMAKIETGKIDFDILLASPKMMPKLIPYARFLGPRGLMPNPKEGTVSADPAKKAKELLAAGVIIKTEKKTPLIHVVFGRISQESVQLKANLEAVVKAVGKQNIKSLAVSTTMSPGIKVEISD